MLITFKQGPQVTYEHIKVCKAVYQSLGLETFSNDQNLVAPARPSVC